jgi:hypothetical protein
MKTLNQFFATVMLAIGLLGAGCATPNPFHADPQLLQFLADGQTTKEAVLLKLGQPSATLESERFLTYRLGYEKKDGYFLIERAPVGWFGVKYNLVLVFDPQGVLRRHSLVEVR